MRVTSAALLLVVFVTGSAFAQSAPIKPKPTAAEVEEMLVKLRAEMQATKADILAKNISLSAEQAAKFWPMFEQYQKEQNGILDAQLKSIQEYVTKFNTLDDATALTLMNGHFDRDAKINALRKKWLAEFQKVLPGKLAVRAMQVDRRLSLLTQYELASRIPLAE